MNDEVRRSIAIEEFKILSSIIGRIESAIYQKQGWSFTLITGLTLALLKDNPLICKQQFAAISISVTLVFYIADIVQRVPVHRAINRSRVVEAFLRGDSGYNGPSISDSIGQGEGFKDFFKFFWKLRVWAPYVGTGLFIFIVYEFAP